MIVQRTSLDLQSVKAGSVVMSTPQGFFAFLLSAFTLRKNHLSTVNFGDQSPREEVTATATTVHDKTAGEQSWRRQRISHHKRGFDFSFNAYQNIKKGMNLLGKKLYLLSLINYQQKYSPQPSYFCG